MRGWLWALALAVKMSLLHAARRPVAADPAPRSRRHFPGIPTKQRNCNVFARVDALFCLHPGDVLRCQQCWLCRGSAS